MGIRKNSAVLLTLVLAFLLAVPVFAHEGGKHFMGTLKAVDADSITLVTTANETVTIKVMPSTKILKSGQPASLQDLKAGDRVVVHARQNGSSLEAEQVQFGATTVHAAH